MRVRWLAVLCALVSVCAQAQVSAIDARGVDVVLQKPAQRIVSLAPNVTELLYAAGAGSRIVGVSAFSDYPPQAGALPRIGNSTRLDLERILSLHPDLVVGWLSGNGPSDIEHLQQAGLPVFLSEPDRLARIPGLIVALGHLAGTDVQARRAAQDFRAGLGRLRARYAARTSLSVFFQISSEPLITLNDRQIVSDVLHLCGASNVFGNLRSIAPQIGREDVLRADPDVILIAEPRAEAEADRARWLRITSLRAARAQHIYVLDPDLIQRPGPRLLEGARQMCAVLQAARHSSPRRDLNSVSRSGRVALPVATARR